MDIHKFRFLCPRIGGGHTVFAGKLTDALAEFLSMFGGVHMGPIEVWMDGEKLGL